MDDDARDGAMMIDRRRLFGAATLGGVTLALGACATRPPSPAGQTQSITLVEAFRGRTVGTGVFRVPITGLERRFRADLVGTLRGDRLTVVEDFFFDDGEVDRLTWRFQRTGPRTWTGQREDTVGLASVIETGTEIRLEYTADVRSRGSVTRLGFADVIYRRADGVVVNEAVVTRSGLPIGSVLFELRRR
jgi:hypothetical protein